MTTEQRERIAAVQERYRLDVDDLRVISRGPPEVQVELGRRKGRTKVLAVDQAGNARWIRRAP
jgi:hypothetical protein